MSGKIKFDAVRCDERARRFVEAMSSYLRTGNGECEVDDDHVVFFNASVGDRGFEVRCWYESDTSRAHIEVLFSEVYPPDLVKEVAAFSKPMLDVPRKVGGRLQLGFDGDVTWTSHCQSKPSDPIDVALAKELVSVGISESNRLLDQIAAFVAGRTASIEEADADGPWKPYLNVLHRKEEPLN